MTGIPGAAHDDPAPHAGRGGGRDQVATVVLRAAAVVLAERGETASMADIAHAAGVGRATLYRCFPTRDALLTALVKTAAEELTERLDAADLDHVPVAEALSRLTRAVLATGSTYLALVRTGRTPARGGAAERLVAGRLRALFRRGVNDGTLRGDISPETLLTLFGGMIEAALPLAARDAGGVERASAAATSLFLTGARRTPR